MHASIDHLRLRCVIRSSLSSRDVALTLTRPQLVATAVHLPREPADCFQPAPDPCQICWPEPQTRAGNKAHWMTHNAAAKHCRKLCAIDHPSPDKVEHVHIKFCLKTSLRGSSGMCPAYNLARPLVAEECRNASHVIHAALP